MPVSRETTTSLFRQVLLLGRAAKAASGREPIEGVRVGGVLMLGCVEMAGEVRVGDLAEQLGLDISVVSRQLTVFESHGLTTRRPDPRDGRAWLVTVTPDGAQLLARARENRSRVIQQALIGWEEGEAEILVSQLQRLETDLSRAAHDLEKRKVRS